ncbi:MAG: homogentisate phytyltransferase [Cyanobacteria bacterium REEB459]|nr:homogentisate phytyltransferase [Cyanobacteria bacterium REEB459]
MPDQAPDSISTRPASPLPEGPGIVLWCHSLWQFWRPHTVVGTALSVIALAVIVLTPISGPGPLGVLSLMGLTLAACLLGNLYIVGLNQLEDIEIDRINKPHLPLAAGEFSLGQGRWIVAIAGLGALGLATAGGPWLLATVGLSLALGTAYSLPPLRLKRFPFWASFCILAVRGAVVNLGLFLHFSDRLGQPLIIPGRVWALTLFMLGFSLAIAWFKDIPDIEGDRRYGIRTLSLQLGQLPVFRLARAMLSLCYLAMMLAAVGLGQVNRPFLALSHGGVLVLFWWVSRRVRPTSTRPLAALSYANFYQFIWKLFFLEYLLFPLACWWA